jgi:hypothetical protein
MLAIAQDFYTAESLQQIYLGVLSENDIEGWVDEDGDVQFEYAEKSYFIAIYEDDPEYFQLSMFNIWPIESHLEATQVLLALDTVNRDQKVVKGYTIDNDVWLNIEMFLSSPFDATVVFMRALETLEDSVDTFVSAM